MEEINVHNLTSTFVYLCFISFLLNSIEEYCYHVRECLFSVELNAPLYPVLFIM